VAIFFRYPSQQLRLCADMLVAEIGLKEIGENKFSQSAVTLPLLFTTFG